MHQFVEIDGYWVNFAHVQTIEIHGANEHYSLKASDGDTLAMLSREEVEKALSVLDERAYNIALAASGT